MYKFIKNFFNFVQYISTMNSIVNKQIALRHPLNIHFDHFLE